jgi:hypothetical protein
VFAILMAWIDLDFVFYLIYTLSSFLCIAFLSHSPKLTLFHLLY